MLATSRCTQCSDLYLLLLIPFALAGILLIVLLNITIATGKIHGLIFYVNILAANRSIVLPNTKLTVFVSWVNLDLGIETCFYNGMNSQGKVLLQLVFPAYLFLLMFLIIILSKYFNLFANLLYKNNIIICELSPPHLDLQSLQSLHQRRDPPCCLHPSLKGPGFLGLPHL